MTDLSSMVGDVRRFRFLQEDTTDDDNAVTPNDGKVLRNTFMVYGSILCLLFLFFCWVRRRFPKPYTLRNWVKDIKTPLAESQHGFFSWIWRQQVPTEDEIMEECGMDALCFLRVLRCGYKVSVLGMINAIWLMPLYATADTSEETALITDNIIEVTISHVPAESKRLIGTAFAAYMLFGYTMYLIYKEFDWFIEQRQKFLKRPLARNYAVYVQGIPLYYRNDAALKHFFGQCYSHETIVESTIRVNTPNLAKAISSRDTVVANLEHSIAFEDIKGVAPTHRESMIGGVQVDSIQAYAEELNELNKDVQDRITAIDKKIHSDAERPNGHGLEGMHLLPSSASSVTHLDDSDPLAPNKTVAFGAEDPVYFSHSSNPLAMGVSAFKASAAAAVALVEGQADGKLYEAGFVVFTKLNIVHAALQMVHSTPFVMETFAAPDPDDILWQNVGKNHRELQLGKLASVAITITICLLWTIPMTFFASLSSVEGLKAEFEWIADAIESYPFLGPLLEQLAPLLVVVFNSLLPVILEAVSMLEHPISGSLLETSMFTKLSAFMIIQTFFVSAISGGLLQEINAIISDPTSIVDLLANSLPAQSTYFIQIVFVGTTLMVGMEVVRIIPLALAGLRRFIGPNLTDKERNTVFMGIRPLCDPIEFEHADTFSQVVLFFMVLLVYSVIAPITNFVMGFCFLYMNTAYRHQFIYIYPARPDSGGKLWTSFIGILLVCIFIAEITITGLLALKKARIAYSLMFPLLAITVLFNVYIKQEHFRVAENLASRECLKTDLQNGDLDMSFVKGAFTQPELKANDEFPENISEIQAIALGFEKKGHPLEESSVTYGVSGLQHESDPVEGSYDLGR